MSVEGPPRLGSIEAACKLIGGDKPIHRGTFYRGVKRGIYLAIPPFTKVRREDELEAAIRALAEADQARA